MASLLVYRSSKFMPSKMPLNFHRPVVLGAILSLLTLSPAQHARGQVILTAAANNLYNTGYNGTTLAGNNQLDTHYTLTNHGSGQTFQANPLAPGWVANPSNSQWITIANNTNLGPSVSFTYQLKLTNIPAGSLVTITGNVAADDNATISANSKSPVFSNFSPGVVAGNYNFFQAFGPLTFISGASNVINILVANTGGLATGLNLELNGSYVPLTSTVGLGIQLSPPGLTQNQTAVLNSINAINAVGTSNSCFANLTVSLLGASLKDIGPDLDQLSPEKLGVLSTIAFNDATFRTQDLDDYLAHRRNAQGNLQVYPDHFDTTGLTMTDSSMDPGLSPIKSRLLAWNPDPSTPGRLRDVDNTLDLTAPTPAPDDFYNNWNVFMRGNVVLGQQFSQPEIDHTDYTTSSFQLGLDYQIGPHLLVGTVFDYSHTDTALDNMGSSATVDSYSPGFFASYADGGWFVNGLATYSWNSYTTARHISFGSFDETANAAPTGNEVLGNLDGGYEFHDKRWTFGPTAGIQYLHYNVDPFTENGGCSSDLTVNNQDADSLRSRLGGRVSYAMPDHDNHVVFTPYLDASWQHEFMAGSRTITSSFSEFNTGSIIVSTRGTSRDSALVVVGLDADITRSMTLFTDYAAQAGESDYFGQSVEAGMKIGF
jgi:uncharacterized protein YhjY with autotransporter beta-barrel domain